MDASLTLDALKELTTYAQAVELFGALGYSDASDAPIPRRLLPDGVPMLNAKYLAERGGFKILYIQLDSAQLSRAQQRKVIDALIHEHPFCLFVFHNHTDQVDRTLWEFINVKYGKTATSQQQRKLIRRITIGPSERIQNRLRTAAERIVRLDLSARPHISPLEIQSDIHDTAFDVEQVTRDFYRQYIDVFNQFVSAIAEHNPTLDLPKQRTNAEHEGQLLLDRLMFLYFIQKKGWLNAQDDYLYRRFYDGPRLALSDSSYYRDAIAPLFQVLSRPLQPDTPPSIGHVPFLNGGLFQFDNVGVSLGLTIPNSAFKAAFDGLFERYAFTIEEDTPLDKAVAIDPEMLGKVFETFVLTREQDKDLRKATGSYYTPRNIVSFMCQQSLQAYLTGRWRAQYQPVSADGQLPMAMTGGGGQLEIRSVGLAQQEIEYNERLLALIVNNEANRLSKDEARHIRRWLITIRVVDPAVGSGAFLVGMMQEIVRLITLLDHYTDEHDTRASNYSYNLKRELIENSLYGVDLQEQAVRICELRLWLSLVVEFEPEKANRPIQDWLRHVRPLPNLSYRVRAGNSLIEQVMGEPLQLDAPGASNDLLPVIQRIRDQKMRYFSMIALDEKRVAQTQILILKATLTRDYLTFQARRLNDKLNVTIAMNVPGMEHAPTHAERKARTALEADRDHLEDLAKHADAIRREAYMLDTPSRDMDKLVALEKALGAFIWKIDFSDAFTPESASVMNGHAANGHAANGSAANGGGFDICIGNPPYIRQERIKDQKPALERLYKDSVYAGTADLYVYFYAKGLALLRDGGILSFITPNKFLRAGYGERLRSYLASQTRLETLVDFGDLPVFDATTYPLVSVIRKAAPNADSTLRAVNIHDMEQLDLLAKIVNTAPPMPQSSLRAEGWQLADSSTLQLMDKLRAAGQPLGEYVGGKLYYGIKTGFNEAFVIDSATRDRLIAADPNSADVIKPWLRGQDVKRWRTEWAKLYLIDAVIGIEIQKYPAILAHLTDFKDQLERRAGTQKWYELQAQGNELRAYTNTGRIIFQEIATYQSFAYTEGDVLINNKCFLIPTNDLYLLGILNSQPSWFLLGQIASKLQGGAFAMQSIYVEQIPIPAVAADLRAEIEIIVRQLLDLRGPGDQVAALEAQLNALVYRAYQLSAADIRLIEGDPTLAQVQAAHPDQWVVMEVTKRKDKLPSNGVVLYAGRDRAVAEAIAEKNQGKILYVFYNGNPFESSAALDEQTVQKPAQM